MHRLSPSIVVVATLLCSAPAFAQDDAPLDDGSIDLTQMPSDEATPEEARAGEGSERSGLAPRTPPKQALSERLAGEAEQAFSDGDYALAIELLQQAYDADQNPNMLYNIARVHEEQGQNEQALDFYRRFVVAPNVDLDYRREALQSSEILEQKLAAEEAARQAPSSASDRGPEQPPMLRPAPFPTTSPMRPLGYALMGIGGASVAAGAIAGVAALQKQAQFEDAGTLDERRSAGASARDLATAADALYISGAVLVVTGLVTAFASPRRERQAAQALNVIIRSDGVGAAWTTRF